MTTDTVSWIGQALAGGRYMVRSKLGEGGMGSVYLAHDHNIDSEVVVKVPRRNMLDDPEFAGRFAAEIRSLVQLTHPQIVKVSDVGDRDGLPFAVMQYLSGGSLRDKQRRGPDGKALPMPPESLMEWLEAVAAALDFIHRKSYIHRDVKPDNILFDGEGHAFLSDFGITKLLAGKRDRKPSVQTGAGMMLGTPEYMAPELIMGDIYDGRVDQYALAVVVYETLSGRCPFEGATATALVVQHATATPPPLESLYPSLPHGVGAALRKAMTKEPANRFPDCASFARVVLDALRTSQRPTSPRSKARLACPACHKTYAVAVDPPGRKHLCPSCGKPLQAVADPTTTFLARSQTRPPTLLPANPGAHRLEPMAPRAVLPSSAVDSPAPQGFLLSPRSRVVAVSAALSAIAVLAVLLGFFLYNRGRRNDSLAEKSPTHAAAGTESTGEPRRPPPDAAEKTVPTVGATATAPGESASTDVLPVSPSAANGFNIDRITLWNEHNSFYGNSGTTACNLVLKLKGAEVWRQDGIDVKWGAKSDLDTSVEVPGIVADAVRVEITRYTRNSGGLSEVEVFSAGRNIALRCRTEASAEHRRGDRRTSANVTDGITSSAVNEKGYWLLPDRRTGWVEIDLTTAPAGRHPE